MAALFSLVLSWFAGIALLKFATGGISTWRDSLFGHTRIADDHTWIITFLGFGAGAIWVGLVITTWVVYILAWISDRLIPDDSAIHPLLPANLVLVLACVLLIVRQLRHKRISRAQLQDSPVKLFNNGKSHLLGSDRSFVLLISSSILFFLIFTCWLMLSSFGSKNGIVSAGYTVFSDFAPHTATVSSFSAGRNWPTIYPHFAGDGISYHFMFFFLCGNLNWLGLPLGLSINLPSILGMLSALILLGLLAVVLTKRSVAFLLAPLLTLARSSMAFFTWMAGLFHEYNGNWTKILKVMKYQREFIGNTPRDDWGLWTINVYANQRHLMPAFAIMLFVILLFLPQITNNSLRSSFLDKRDWLGYNGSSDKGMVLACVLLFLFAYWHGSVLIATLSMLAIMAIFSRARIYYLIAAVSAISGSLLQIAFFTTEGNGVSAKFFWGFIAENKSVSGIFSYLAELTGVLIPLALLTLLLPGRRRKIMLAAFMMPLLVAFTISLTPDVTVNHKFIMISQMLLSIWVAELLIILWDRGSRYQQAAKPRNQVPDIRLNFNSFRSYLLRFTVIFIGFVLLSTGLTEWRIFANANQGQYMIEENNQINEWIEEETSADAVFITAPWHYHSFFLTGRSVWLGHSYYAWSAGHDTGGRLSDLQKLLAGEWSAVKIISYAERNDIDYLLIDEDLRTHAQFTVNERFFQENFTTMAAFNDHKQTIIYDLRH